MKRNRGNWVPQHFYVSPVGHFTLSFTFTRVVSVTFSPWPWFQHAKLSVVLFTCLWVLGPFVLHIGKCNTVAQSTLQDWRELAWSDGWTSPLVALLLHAPAPSLPSFLREGNLCPHLEPKCLNKFKYLDAGIWSSLLAQTGRWCIQNMHAMEPVMKLYHAVLMASSAVAKQKRGDDENWKRNSNGAQLSCIKWETNTG